MERPRWEGFAENEGFKPGMESFQLNRPTHRSTVVGDVSLTHCKSSGCPILRSITGDLVGFLRRYSQGRLRHINDGANVP